MSQPEYDVIVLASGHMTDVGERAYTGDVVTRVKQQIQTAPLVVAVLTGKNPNVYLELGFAWGMGRPAVLVVHDSEDLPFDVQGQRSLKYKDITDLEEKLSGELTSLQADGVL